MVCVAIPLCLFLGAALACTAGKVPSHVLALERCGGALLVLSLALLGGFLHYFGEVHYPPKIESRLIGAATYSDAGSPNRIITAAAPGASQAAVDW